MYRLFEGESNPIRSRIINAQVSFATGIVKKQVDAISAYARGSGKVLPNQHLLCRLLDLINIPTNGLLDRYMEEVNDRSYYLAETLQVTTPTSYGIIHRTNQFYTGADEVIVFDSDEFDWTDCENNWMTFQPVKILKHPFTGLYPVIPDGNIMVPEKGLVVISINVPMLMLQYRMWKNTDGKVGNTKEEFLFNYPTVNAMRSHTDIALMNRMMALWSKKPVERFKHFYPSSAIVDVHSRYDTNVLKHMAELHRKSPKLFMFLDNLYAIDDRSMAEALTMPSLAPTRQVKWATILARLEMMEFLKFFRSTMLNPPDQNLVDRLHQSLQIGLNDSALDRLIPNYEQERISRILA